jgi:Flp pilus assembly protein TadG
MKKKMMRKLRGFVREESGSELVEFTMSAAALMFILLVLIETMWAVYAYHFTTYAAQQGARFAMVRGYTWSHYVSEPCSTTYPGFTMPYSCTASQSDVQNYVDSLATGGINPSKITVTANWTGTAVDGSGPTTCGTTNNQAGCLVQVKVAYTFNYLPFLTSSGLNLSATSEKVILQ